jgi:hypothetical protein
LLSIPARIAVRDDWGVLAPKHPVAMRGKPLLEAEDAMRGFHFRCLSCRRSDERRAFLWKLHSGGTMHQLIKRSVVLGLTCGLSACASIVGGTHQHLSVETRSPNQEVVVADCTVTNERGVQHVTTPGIVTVHRGSGPIDVRCVKDGAPIGGDSFASKVRPMEWGNLVFGGLIGLVVDFSDDAAHHYPDVLKIMTTYSGQPSANAYASPAAAAGMSSTSASMSSSQPDGLASMDRRISSATFNAAQNVAARLQCDRAIHVLMADGQRALLESACPASATLEIECRAADCVPMHKAG